MYYLKLFDEDLISFKMDNQFGLVISDVKILSENKNIFPYRLKENVTAGAVEEFIKSRIIPKNRAFVQNILEMYGLSINDRKAIIDISKGLSLTDCYWIVQDNTLKFADYNLFDNQFSTVLSLVAFTGYSSKIKGLTTSPEFTTNGMLPKAWRRINEEIFLFKGSTKSYNFANTGFEPYVEFLASQVAKKMGVDCVEYNLSKWKKMISSKCRVFTSKNIAYVQIADVVPYGGIKNVAETLKKMGFEEKFSNMILFDAICINPDRHYGNFGFLRDNHTGDFVDFAPIFDNGESLLSKALPVIFENKEEFLKYIEKPEINVSYYGASYDDLVKEFCNKSHIKMLRKLLDFKFLEHSAYYISRKRLDCLSFMIRERAKRFIKIISEKDNN